MKGALSGIGFLLLFLGGIFLGGAVGIGLETGEAMSFGVAAGLCCIASMVSLWLAHRKDELRIDLHDYLVGLEEDSKTRSDN